MATEKSNAVNEQLGKFMRELRKAKGFTIAEAAGDEMSPTHLSNFENGRTNLSAHLFLAVLANINVNLFEFQNAYNHNLSRRDETLYSTAVSQAFLLQNKVELKHLLKQLDASQSSRTLKKNKLEKIRLQAVLLELEPDFAVDKNDVDYLVNYLKGLKSWGYYEVLLFGDCVPLFDILTLSDLVHRMIAPMQLNFDLVYVKQVRIQAVLNCIEAFRSAQQFRLADELIAYLEQTDIHEYWTFEKLMLVYRKAKNDWYKGEEQALGTLKKVQALFEFAGCFKLAEIIAEEIKDKK